jgi:hypothetical protein
MRQRQSGADPARATLAPVSTVGERHYRVGELAQAWGLSVDLVRRLFAKEPGALRLGDFSRPELRCRTTLRIPESVAERVYRRLSNGS